MQGWSPKAPLGEPGELGTLWAECSAGTSLPSSFCGMGGWGWVLRVDVSWLRSPLRTAFCSDPGKGAALKPSPKTVFPISIRSLFTKKGGGFSLQFDEPPLFLGYCLHIFFFPPFS